MPIIYTSTDLLLSNQFNDSFFGGLALLHVPVEKRGVMLAELAIVPRALRSGPEIHTQPVVVTVVQPDLPACHR